MGNFAGICVIRSRRVGKPVMGRTKPSLRVGLLFLVLSGLCGHLLAKHSTHKKDHVEHHKEQKHHHDETSKKHSTPHASVHHTAEQRNLLLHLPTLSLRI